VSGVVPEFLDSDTESVETGPLGLEGDSLILTPIRSNRLRDLLASWEPLYESVPEVEDLPPQARDEF
jgi:hypothetical protein